MPLGRLQNFKAIKNLKPQIFHIRDFVRSYHMKSTND